MVIFTVIWEIMIIIVIIITVNDVRLQGLWKAIFERKHPLETTLRAKDNLYLTAVLNMFDDVLPDSVAYFQGHFAKKW